jgi:hypothetical protein
VRAARRSSRDVTGARRALACIDALGPPDTDPNDVPRRYASWFADLDKSVARLRPVLTLADATARLRERFPHFPERCAAHLALHGTRSLNGDANGARVWKFDPLHQTTAPTPFYVRARGLSGSASRARSSTSPARTARSGSPPPTKPTASGAPAECVELPGVGHSPAPRGAGAPRRSARRLSREVPLRGLMMDTQLTIGRILGRAATNFREAPQARVGRACRRGPVPDPLRAVRAHALAA